MPELEFQIEALQPATQSATPSVTLKLRIRCAETDLQIQNVLLQCQVQIEPARRSYANGERERLFELFGAPSMWSRTLRPLLWANPSVVVSPFQGETAVEISLPCTFDFNAAATKYFYGLESGDVPICVLPSGTIFYTADGGILQVAKIPWDRELHYRFPASLWREVMDMHYPHTAFLSLDRDIVERIQQYKISRGIATWDQAFSHLLEEAEAYPAQKAAV